jgi:RNA polymerase-binding transcription factor DksA
MADEIDQANELASQHLDRSIRAARAPVPAGVPGQCEECGEEMPRLVGGRCGFCRDGRVRE